MASNPTNPSNPTQTQNVLNQIGKITDIAAKAVLQAQEAGIGQSGETKKDMALKIVHIGLQTAGIFIPGVAAGAAAEQQLEPLFVPMFTSLVNLFRSHNHPAFKQAPAPPSPMVPPQTPAS